VTIGFEAGVPVALDGDAVDPWRSWNGSTRSRAATASGRIDHVEDRLVGIKSREIYEAPAAVVLHQAHAALEGLTLSKEQLRFNRFVSEELSQSTYDGLWFSALHRDLREYIRSAQRVVTGEVRMRLDHGTASVVGRRSEHSLYDWALATYDSEDAFDHASAVGFIEIFGLPLRTEAARHASAWTWTPPLLGELPLRVTDAEPAKGEPVGAAR
jgi:argininosuccinate synthase